MKIIINIIINKIRDAGEPFNKVIITHDLTKKQKEELKQMVEQTKEKENEDQSGEIYVLSGMFLTPQIEIEIPASD